MSSPLEHDAAHGHHHLSLLSASSEEGEEEEDGFELISPSSSKLRAVRSVLSSGTAQFKSPRRAVCEDVIVTSLIAADIYLFGIVDGHCGLACAKFVSQAIPFAIKSLYDSMQIANDLDAEAWASLIESAFDSTASTWDAMGSMEGGAVCTIAVINLRTKRMIVGHVGDCKVLVSGKLEEDTCIELTKDHRCSDPEEALRIQSMGAVLVNGRLHGLMPSRSFGDINIRLSASRKRNSLEEMTTTFLRCIKPDPDLCFYNIAGDGEFILIASDGLFDAMSPHHAIEFVRGILISGHSAQHAATQLVQFICHVSTDDVSVIVVIL